MVTSPYNCYIQYFVKIDPSSLENVYGQRRTSTLSNWIMCENRLLGEKESLKIVHLISGCFTPPDSGDSNSFRKWSSLVILNMWFENYEISSWGKLNVFISCLYVSCLLIAMVFSINKYAYYFAESVLTCDMKTRTIPETV